MYSQTTYADVVGRCGWREQLALSELWRATYGREGGREGGRESGGREGGRGGGRGGRGHRHRREGWFGPGWGGGGMGGPFGDFPGGGRGGRGGHGGRGRRARRGDIRTAALLLLAEEPRNGYQIMQEVEERSEGVWRPSAGSVYPALQQLEDEGLISSQEIEGRKLFAITDAGRELLQERDSDQPAPWERMSEDVSDDMFALGRVVREVMSAFKQVMQSGSESQIKQACEVLARTRRDLYRILADGEAGAPESDSGDDKVDGEK